MQTLYRWFWYLLPANPMVVRIVQGGSRRPRHAAVRITYLGALILLVTMGLLFGQGMTANATLSQLAKAGTAVFEQVAYGQVILICLLSPLFMAGAIVSERSGQTYEILLSTPLSNLQIVLGSLVGRLFFILALLASGIPLFAVLLIFGGVAIDAVFTSFAIAALTAVTVGAVAVTLSTMRTGGRKAVFVFVIAVAGYLVAFYVLDHLVLRRLTPGSTTWMTPLHPLLVLEASLNAANYRPPTPAAVSGHWAPIAFYLSRPFAAFSALSLGLSTVLVLWCAVRLRAVGQGEGRLRLWLRRKLRLGGLPGQDRRRPPREVWQNPVAWREASTRGRFAASILGRWSFVLVGLGLGFGLLWAYHTGRMPTVTGATGAPIPPANVFQNAMLTLILLELAVITMVALYMSAGAVSREREDGSLDLMLTTPITPRAYIWGKLRGLISFVALLLAVPVLTLTMLSVYQMLGSAMQWPQARVSYSVGTVVVKGHLMLPEAPLLLLLVLLPFVALCVMVGMSWSIKSRGVLGAVVPSLAVIGGLAMVTGFCGWNMAENVPLIGPMINAFSPTTNVVMILNPWERMYGFLEHPSYGRINLLVAALIAAGGYSVIVYSMLTAIVRNFDHTVRRLSGTG